MNPRASVLALCLLATTGCVEWLEVDTPVRQADAESAGPASLRSPLAATLPNVPPRASADGPIVPQTPGLRVPDGYWTRVRLDQADLLLPYTWGLIQPSGYSEEGAPRGMVLRLQAQSADDHATSAPRLRGLIRVATPPHTRPSQLVGVSFGPDALVDSTVSLRISRGTLWDIVPERLSIEVLDGHVMKGTLEGSARAGKQARRSRAFRAAFVALLAGGTEHPTAPSKPLNP